MGFKMGKAFGPPVHFANKAAQKMAAQEPQAQPPAEAPAGAPAPAPLASVGAGAVGAALGPTTPMQAPKFKMDPMVFEELVAKMPEIFKGPFNTWQKG